VKLTAYLWSLLAVVGACVATFLIQPWMGPNLSLMFFPAVVVAAVYGGYGPAMFATVVSTLALAFFFVPPRYSFEIGADDWIRLTAFVAVAVATSALSAARRRAQEAQRRALDELHAALTTLRKVSGWPTFVGAGLAAGSHQLLAHAATVVGCRRAIASWETEDEPWMYVADSASSSDAPAHLAPTEPPGDAAVLRGSTLECQGPRGEACDASAPFELEHVAGRVFFIGVAAPGPDLIPLAEVVAREVGNSLEHLYIHHRLQQLAVREDRIRLARDLHDGVLQADRHPISTASARRSAGRNLGGWRSSAGDRAGDRDRAARAAPVHRGPEAGGAAPGRGGKRDAHARRASRSARRRVAGADHGARHADRSQPAARGGRRRATARP
jgi:signal transduction histidine kinase